MYIVLLGPPGSGKGTQAAGLSHRLGVPAISTGDLLRANVAAGTALGRQAAAIMAAGDLVSDELINGMLADRLAQPDAAGGAVLDGYPRTVEQAQELERQLGAEHSADLQAIALVVDPAEVVVRLGGRRTCAACGAIGRADGHDDRCVQCGGPTIVREDDQPEAIARRLEVFALQTAPVTRHYEQRGQLASIDAAGEVEDVAARIAAVLDRLSV